MDYFNPNDYWNHQGYDPYNGMNDEERLKAGCCQMVVFIAAVAISMIVCSFFTSCKSVEYVPVIEHHTDTLIQTKVQHDSVYINDSTVITEKGDTVKIEKWHTKYVEKQVHDTTYVAKRDSVPYPVEVVKEVQRPLAKTQIAMMVIGFICMFLVVIYIGRKIRGLLP